MTWLLVTRCPCGPALAPLSLIPRHPYSAVRLSGNCQLWRNFPDATQQISAATNLRSGSRRIAEPELTPGRARSVGSSAIGRSFAGTVFVVAGWRGAQYDGIVAKAAARMSRAAGGGGDVGRDVGCRDS